MELSESEGIVMLMIEELIGTLGIAPVVPLTETVPVSSGVPVYEVDERSVRALPDGLVPGTDVVEGAGTRVWGYRYGYGGAELLPASLTEELTWPAGLGVPVLCGSRVPAVPAVDAVSTVMVEVQVCSIL